MPRCISRATRRHLICAALVSVAASSSVSAQNADSLDCKHAVTVEGISYDFASLSLDKTVSRTRDTPPSKMVDELRFNICQDLLRKESVAEGDQCATGTRACLTKTNQKSGVEDRIVAAIPIATTSKLQPRFSAMHLPAGISLSLHGGSYPPDMSSSIPQSLNLTLLCTKDATEPSFVSYENGVVSVLWNTTAGCPTKQEDNGNDGDGNGGGGEKEVETGGSSGGSGIGWFFLLLFVSFVGYFALGAYYNYNNFGATGWDLVPHRDFWRDVPYLFRDFTEHLCSTLRPGRSGGSRRGYMAV